MGGGGFLQGAMQTAAGVAAGALAFEGIESLMHGFGHAAGYGGQGFGGFEGGQRPEEIVNNYYGDSKEERSGHEVSAAERSEGNREDLDYHGRDDRDSLSGSGGDGSSFDSGGVDDSGSGLDDASFNDGSGGDDSGGGGDDGSFA